MYRNNKSEGHEFCCFLNGSGVSQPESI
jgi:hypothetical protein